jgi:hypothetical protein
MSKFIRQSSSQPVGRRNLSTQNIATRIVLGADETQVGDPCAIKCSGKASSKPGANDLWPTKNYVYVWADGVYFSPRGDESKLCMLVLIGALEDGTKEVIAISDGFRESEDSWREVLLDLKNRGLEHAPMLAIGDGALGFWNALRKIFPTTQEQRCWFHKKGNVLSKLPKSLQSKATSMLREIEQQPTRELAWKEMKRFESVFSAKYPKAVRCFVRLVSSGESNVVSMSQLRCNVLRCRFMISLRSIGRA